VLQRAVCDPAVLDLARRSLDIDAGYAPAWLLLGWAHYGRVAACGEGGEHYDEAVRAARKAAALEPADTEALLLETVLLTERGRFEAAYERVAPRMRDATAVPHVRFAAAYALTYAGYLDEAEAALDQALAQNPLYLTDGGWTPNVLLYRGDRERFLSRLPGTDTPIFRWYRGSTELEAGRRGEAIRAVSGVFERFPQDTFARLSLALSEALAGRPAAARTAVLALAQHREAVGSRDGEVTFKQAQVLAFAGDRDGAIEQLTRAVDQGFVCSSCIEGSVLLAPLRSAPGYRPLLARAQARQDAFGRRFGLDVGRRTAGSRNPHESVTRSSSAGTQGARVSVPRLAAR
jgi:tetratricopeptide (TPR) repeat protein